MSGFEAKPVTRTDSLESIESVDFLVEGLEKAQLSSGEDRVRVSEHRLKEKNGELLPEPLLIEDKQRFVLFPIKHQDVGIACVSSVDRFPKIRGANDNCDILFCLLFASFFCVVCRFGTCTRRLRLRSGPRRSWTWPMTTRIGRR